VAARRRARGDVVDFHVQLDHLRSLAAEIQSHVTGGPAVYRTGSPLPLAATPAAQAAALRAVCAQVLALMPAVEQLGGHVPPSPMGEIETLLRLAE
jgi:hypothetical protein